MNNAQQKLAPQVPLSPENALQLASVTDIATRERFYGQPDLQQPANRPYDWAAETKLPTIDSRQVVPGETPQFLSEPSKLKTYGHAIRELVGLNPVPVEQTNINPAEALASKTRQTEQLKRRW